MSDQYSIMSQEELLIVVGEKDRRIAELKSSLSKALAREHDWMKDNERLRAALRGKETKIETLRAALREDD